MKIICQKRSYDTKKPADLKHLKDRLLALKKEGKTAALDLVRTQIKKESLVTLSDIELYKILTDEPVSYFQFDYNHFKDGDNKIKDVPFFTFDGEGFFCLPDGKDGEEIVFKLMDKLLYELQRHGRALNHQPCKMIVDLINKINPATTGYDVSTYKQALRAYQRRTNTYCGSYLSEDSDSEAEVDYNLLSPEEKTQRSVAAEKLHTRGELNRYRFQFGKSAQGDKIKPVPPKLDIREKIHHANGVRAAAQTDLHRLNTAIREGNVDRVIGALGTQFVVAQYRGLHYGVDQWNIESRRAHRAFNEVGLPQYSLSVIKAAGYDNFSAYMAARVADPNIDQHLLVIAEDLRNKLVALRDSGAVTFEGYSYASQAHMLQSLYTRDYEKFHQYISKHYQGSLRQYLLNAHNPFVSSGDVPRHALLYAYGRKAYAGNEDKLLKPRYRSDGRPERPYSGKVFVSLHPVTDFIGENKPMHLPELFWNGETTVTPIIVSERENCFPGFIPGGRVILQHIAKYPSFSGTGVKQIVPEKYGLTSEDVATYRRAFAQHTVGKTQRDALERTLGECFCAYQEARLIELAGQRAAAEGKVLIYRQNDGTFGFDVPQTVPSYNDQAEWGKINSIRGTRESVSPPKASVMQPLYPQDAIATVFNSGQKETVRRQLFPLFPQMKAKEAVHDELISMGRRVLRNQ